MAFAVTTVRTNTDFVDNPEKDIELDDIFDQTSNVERESKVGEPRPRLLSHLRTNSAVDPSMEPRGFSVKSTPRSLMDVPSPLKKVALTTPHFLDSMKKVFFRLILPFAVLTGTQLWFQWKACQEAYAEVDNEGIGNCFTLPADVLSFMLFVVITVAGYLTRKELLKASPLIFNFVELMDPREVTKLAIKSQKEWTDTLLGRHDKFRAWNIRGHVVLPGGLAAVFFIGLLYNNFFVYTEGGCVGSSCGPDNTVAYGPAGKVFHAMRVSANIYLASYAMMTAFYPFMLISLIVGPSIKSRIGLWNQGDISLGEVQRISMHVSLYFSAIGFVYLLIALFYADYNDIAFWKQCIYIIIIAGTLVAVLFLPIVPAISALKVIKEQVTADVCALEERANKDFLDLLRLAVKERLEPGEIEYAEAELARIAKYRVQVQSARIIPSSVEVVQTSVSSLFIGIILPIIISQTLGA